MTRAEWPGVALDPPAEPRLDLLVKGARCAACIGKIERAMLAMPGVSSARLNLTTGRLSLAGRAGDLSTEVLVERLASLGYPAAPFDVEEALRTEDREGRRLAIALGVAAFGAMNVMMFTVPVWTGAAMGEGVRTFMYWAAAAVAVPCSLFAGAPFFESAWRALRRGRANMDVPISIGVLLTLAVSVSETILRGEHAYFDAAVSLLFLLLIGRYLDHRLRARARSAARGLLALQAPNATVIGSDSTVRRIPSRDVRVGDRLEIAPGDRVPVDVRVEEGASELDVSLVTGETLPATAVAGTSLAAGSLNLTGRLVARAVAVCEDSTVAAVARMMEAGAQSRSRYVQLAEKAAAIYIPVVHAVALLTALGWLVAGEDLRTAILRAAAVLIITCPCALGLAVPAVQVVACGRLFRQGVLVKSGAALERLAEVNHVVFDKTGVLTEGRPVLVGGSVDLARLAAPLARASRHPLAAALAEAAGEGPVATDTRETAGFGIEGLIDGRTARLGRAEWVGAPSSGAGTELWFGFADETKIRFAFHDELRPEARAAIDRLRGLGLGITILSGDTTAPVRAAAERLSVDAWRSGLSPLEKGAALDEMKAEGLKVLMVGDGLNDAGALAKAHASMAPGTAVSASQNAADLVFEHGLEAVAEAIVTARRARARALENFGLSALYNLLAAPLAIAGLATPFVAAIAMSASSLIVTLNALRLSLPGGKP